MRFVAGLVQQGKVLRALRPTASGLWTRSCPDHLGRGALLSGREAGVGGGVIAGRHREAPDLARRCRPQQQPSSVYWQLGIKLAYVEHQAGDIQVEVVSFSRGGSWAHFSFATRWLCAKITFASLNVY